MNQNTHVYCTECARSHLDDSAYTNCGCEDRCDSSVPEDSRPFSERPMYIEKIEKQGWLLVSNML